MTDRADISRTAFVAGLALFGAACTGLLAVFPAESPARPTPAITPAQTTAALAAGNCNLCHVVPEAEGIAPGIQPAGREESCTGCHIWIRDTSRDPAKRKVAMQYFPKWERYEKSIRSYLQVPSLEAAMARLEPEWVEGWLADPHDVRPALPENMPRFDLDADQRRAIAAAFAANTAEVPKTPKPSARNVEAGRVRFMTAGCTACHSLGGVFPAENGIAMAPDLAHVRDRMSPDMAVAWMLDPQGVSSAATMVAVKLEPTEAVAIRDFLFLADPEGREPNPAEPVPAATTEPVTWAMVEERVFGRICVHCHMDPDDPSSQGRRGPGNAGGFGWDPTGIELQSLAGVRAHAERIVPALLRRRDEAARDTVQPGERPKSLTRPEKPGMPLGLPPLSDEDLALVLGWIEQGMPE
jgi:mono/diheme cytochrome c family protein